MSAKVGAAQRAHGAANAPSGKRPLFPLTMCLPKYHPSPNSSSLSSSSTRSPFARLNSSELRAWKSSAKREGQCQRLSLVSSTSDEHSGDAAGRVRLLDREMCGLEAMGEANSRRGARADLRITSRISPTTGLFGLGAAMVVPRRAARVAARVRLSGRERKGGRRRGGLQVEIGEAILQRTPRSGKWRQKWREALRMSDGGGRREGLPVAQVARWPMGKL